MIIVLILTNFSKLLHQKSHKFSHKPTGEVSVEWRTLATLNAAPNVDFVEVASKAVLKDGENSTDASVQILDNNVAELSKSFIVSLKNTDGLYKVTGGGKIYSLIQNTRLNSHTHVVLGIL